MIKKIQCLINLIINWKRKEWFRSKIFREGKIRRRENIQSDDFFSWCVNQRNRDRRNEGARRTNKGLNGQLFSLGIVSQLFLIGRRKIISVVIYRNRSFAKKVSASCHDGETFIWLGKVLNREIFSFLLLLRIAIIEKFEQAIDWTDNKTTLTVFATKLISVELVYEHKNFRS